MEEQQSGNYARYYGYRPSGSTGHDARLTLLEEAWFRGKKCVDVGCNSGKLTSEIAMLFGPRYMLGVDVDEALIEKAATMSRRSWQPVVESKTGTALPYPANCFYRTRDVADELGVGDHSFDVVCCFSVTKWVHISRGDEGLLRFFRNIYDALKPGGKFVYEPQPWRSYNKAKQKTHCDLSRLKLRPTDFHTILVDKVGFAKVTDLGVPDDPSLPAGFRRPIYCAVR